ncbi:hypothetical protein Ae505Ps2_6187 [Pseudonocardia sp. Ae505_Ps2]|nr:hypothetical protein Ae505Ps2_6177 [Pseudonocardia sp. Ae505_Ps2]OLM08374.1 hypothetical protein Ae505Ps2_6181 [Pseudonocardia sp. Ae505_Ps2]OLM08377.1 hypothetical protein Ae505Ps2_6184 [Pseudonocardia sp. Ae505_Ps2]OLM08380.1 hypothetical protein Ae505Ps2_6187 [Pseudonocardia sp. Ae505_Ps2]
MTAKQGCRRCCHGCCHRPDTGFDLRRYKIMTAMTVLSLSSGVKIGDEN